MGRALLLGIGVISGCAAAPATEAEEPTTPVIDVDDDGRTENTARGKTNEAQARAKVRAAEIARALAEIEVQTIGALGDGGTVADVLAAGDVPAGLLDVEANRGVTTAASEGLRLGGGSTGAASGGGGKLTTSGPGSGAPAGRAAVRAPTGSVAVKSQVVDGKIANAASVVARMRGRFRRCYAHGQKSDPSLAGTLTLVAAIGANGEVLSVTGGTTSSLKPIVPCLKAVMTSGGFAPPDGGSAAVSVEATFTKMP